MQFFMQYAPDSAMPTDPDHMTKMNAFIEELTQSGVLVSTGALTSGTTCVRVSGSDESVTEGPSPKVSESIIGWAIINADSKEEAIEQAKAFLRVAGDGESIIRPIFSPQDFAASGIDHH